MVDERITCLQGGLLAGVHLPVPEAALARTAEDEPLPCANVRCGACGVRVRVFDGWALTRLPGADDEYEALFATGDPDASDFFTDLGSGPESRVYACRCDAYSLAGQRALDTGGPDPWRCGGHPPLPDPPTRTEPLMQSLENTKIFLARRPRGAAISECFEVGTGPVVEPASGEVLVETLVLSVDPAQRGWMNDVRSYVPPVQLGEVMRAYGVGRVLASDQAAIPEGALVAGLFGWQRYASMAPAGLEVLPDAPDVPREAWLGVLGYPGLTAWFGLFDIGQAKAGEVVLVSAAAGAVGSVTAQLAKITGCTAIGTAGGPDKCRHLAEVLGLDAAIDYRGHEHLHRAIREVAPKGIDVYFDNVGGPLLDAAMRCLRRGARVVICGAIHDYNADSPPRGPGNYMSLLVNRARMEGFVVFDYAPRFAEARAALLEHLRAGRLHHRVTVVEGLENAPAALTRLFNGDKLGKLVLRVSD